MCVHVDKNKIIYGRNLRDGTKLVTVHEPICRARGTETLALLGSGLSRRALPPSAVAGPVPGEVEAAEGAIEINAGRAWVELGVVNRGDRPVQVGSHYPFSETNPLLEFDRRAALGMHLDIPAGTAARFEPGEERKVRLIAAGGLGTASGGQGFGYDPARPSDAGSVLSAMAASGFLGAEARP